MSPVKVSVMLSMVAAAAAVGSLDGLGGFNECELFVEQPTECEKQPGCMVARNGIECIPKTDNWAAVWLQHPKDGHFQPADEKVHGTAVNKRRGGPAFALGSNFLDKLPEFLGETHFHAVADVQKAGGLKFVCPEMEVGVCDFFIAVFSCAPCSKRVNGGLPELLTVSNGWEARSCAPVLKTPEDDDEYKMTIFRVRVENGRFVESPRFLRHARSIAVFSSMKETDFCPVPVRTVGPFPPGKKCGPKCPFVDLVEEV